MSINEPRHPLYQWGQKVKAISDLVNDGSFPDAAPNALLVKSGHSGEIVQIGHQTEENVPVYLVEFGDKLVIGCFEEEIEPV